HPRARRGRAADHARGRRIQLLRRDGRGGSADQSRSVRVGHRQPRQGWRGERRAEPQHQVRLGRAHRARGAARVSLSMAAAELRWLEGGITAVPGILAGGVVAGIKPSGKKDLALIYSSSPARAAAVFTQNQVKGAPVLVSQEHIRDGRAQAIVASSGCSNVCTGDQGLKDAREMTRIVGDLLHLAPRQVLIAATGVIGEPLPMDKIRAGLPKLVKGLSPQGGRSAAEAILTTDTVTKEAALRLDVAGRPVTIGGMAKGVAMLEPHLATMFCFVATDAMVASD